MVHEVTDVTFDSFIHGESCVVVDFYATWCPPCERLSPILDEIAEEFGNELVVGKINVDSNPDAVQQYGVLSMPTVIVFHRGKEMSRFIGYRPKQNMLDLLGLGVI